MSRRRGKLVQFTGIQILTLQKPSCKQNFLPPKQVCHYLFPGIFQDFTLNFKQTNKQTNKQANEQIIKPGSIQSYNKPSIFSGLEHPRQLHRSFSVEFPPDFSKRSTKRVDEFFWKVGSEVVRPLEIVIW